MTSSQLALQEIRQTWKVRQVLMSEYSISPVNQGDVQIIPMEDHRHKSWREKDENNEDIRVNGQVRGNQVDHGVRGFASSSFMYEQAGMLESYT